MTSPQIPHAPAATLAALALFNGFRLAPIHVAPDPELMLIGSAISPKFTQVRRYMGRFFNASSKAKDFNPLEVFDGAMAAAQWIRGGAGVLQYALLTESDIDIPDASSIDPAAWFDGLENMAYLWRGAGFEMPSELVTEVTEAWQERDAPPRLHGSRAMYLARLYAQARELQGQDAFLTAVPAIARARVTRPLGAGQKLAFPHK